MKLIYLKSSCQVIGIFEVLNEDFNNNASSIYLSDIVVDSVNCKDTCFYLSKQNGNYSLSNMIFNNITGYEQIINVAVAESLQLDNITLSAPYPVQFLYYNTTVTIINDFSVSINKNDGDEYTSFFQCSKYSPTMMNFNSTLSTSGMDSGLFSDSNCTVTVSGVPFKLVAYPLPYEKDLPIDWIVFGSCSGFILISLIVAFFIARRKTKTSQYQSIN